MVWERDFGLRETVQRELPSVSVAHIGRSVVRSMGKKGRTKRGGGLHPGRVSGTRSSRVMVRQARQVWANQATPSSGLHPGPCQWNARRSMVLRYGGVKGQGRGWGNVVIGEDCAIVCRKDYLYLHGWCTPSWGICTIGVRAVNTIIVNWSTSWSGECAWIHQR